ncbi:hypothetical protein AB0L42_39115 [Streptomyces sp. NPDC052287]|uniref:hypothetical protein n=1 Tax=Streptomyces sp. NPDC052287 TaxID=3154950 RepID=UPI0034173910
MNRTLMASAAAALLLGALTACSSTPGQDSSDKDGITDAKSLDAAGAFSQLSSKTSTAKLSGTVTAENDPNKLLGRPNQYTSKITFTDSQVSADDVTGTDRGDVSRGGAIEAFGTPADATARAKYIQAVTKGMPALSEYDYVHGTVVVRVSHFLTPKQAAAYESAANGMS